MAASAAFANRAERLIAAASTFLLVPDIDQSERDAVHAARAAVRRGLDRREAEAATAQTQKVGAGK